jgi:L-amino acid N-acyltransferase YncA
MVAEIAEEQSLAEAVRADGSISINRASHGARGMTSSIRLVADDDIAAITALYRPFVESTAISFETEPPGEDEMRRRVGDTLPSYPWLVFDFGGRIAGYAYATKHRVRAAYEWSVDASVYVHPGFHRRGIGRGLYTSLFGILAAQGYCNAFAGITLPNRASVALHESFGFEPVGVYRNVGYKGGAWHDVGWWQLVLRQYDGIPQRPVSLRAMQSRDDWGELLTRGVSAVRADLA